MSTDSRNKRRPNLIYVAMQYLAHWEEWRHPSSIGEICLFGVVGESLLARGLDLPRDRPRDAANAARAIRHA